MESQLEDCIEKVARRLPDLPPLLKKNIFDILGVQNKETINSRILAYFLDPNEEHDFQTLFFDSLVQVLIEKKGKNWESSNYFGQFKVNTEELTEYAKDEDQKQKRIDITVKGDDWCIIIENKLYHHLQNPLKAYWEHAEKGSIHVAGIVLSLDKKTRAECTEDEIEYTNITHEEWMTKVQANLVLSDINNDTDIIYLREYLKTINTHYQHIKNKPIMNDLVQSLIEQRDDIATIEAKKAAAVKYISRQIAEVFAERGYVSVNQWYCHPKDNNLCFWVITAEEILAKNHIRFTYEVFNQLKKELGNRVTQIRDVLEKKADGYNIFVSDENDVSNMSRLITYKKENLLSPNKDFKSEFEGVLDAIFFNEGGVEQTVLNLLPTKYEPARLVQK